MKRTRTELAAIMLLAIGAAFLLGLFLGRGGASERVLHLPEQTIQPAGEQSGEQDAHLLDINTATSDELQTLPGIGEELAARIIAYREQYGSFTVPEELLNVSGIGEKKLEMVRSYITVKNIE